MVFPALSAASPCTIERSGLSALRRPILFPLPKGSSITLKDPDGELSLEGAAFLLDEGFSTQGMLVSETDTVVISFKAVNGEESVELYWLDSLTGEYSGSLRASAKMSKKTVQYGGSVTLVPE